MPQGMPPIQNEVEADESCGARIGHKLFNPLPDRERGRCAFKSHRYRAAVCTAAVACCGHYPPVLHPTNGVKVGALDLTLHQQFSDGGGNVLPAGMKEMSVPEQPRRGLTTHSVWRTKPRASGWAVVNTEGAVTPRSMA